MLSNGFIHIQNVFDRNDADAYRDTFSDDFSKTTSFDFAGIAATLVVVTIPVEPLMDTMSKTAVKGKETKDATSSDLRLAADGSSEMRWSIPETASRVVTMKLETQ